ncbi:phenylalanine ammonium lyase, partial [Clavulina sp. PMI_390]
MTTVDTATGPSAQFVGTFIRVHSKLNQHKSNDPVVVDGHSLTIADVVAAARFGTNVELCSSEDVRLRVDRAQQAIESKLAAGSSVYGLSTGFGGSADTRTNASLVLGKSLLQHQHGGVLPSPESTSSDKTQQAPLPLSDPLQGTSMPESWVRAAILIRMNSLIRGHSGVRWKFIEALGQLLQNNITPLVPLRGSISASGDLSPLSYVAGTLIGNPSIRAYSTSPSSSTRRIVSSREAYAEHSLSHITFEAKEHLGLLNGTAFSAAAASLAIQDVMHVGVLAMVTTALGTEALLGMQGSHDPFIHTIARPHPGQVEAATVMHSLLEGSSLAVLGEEKELSIEEDVGKLRQDRYPLRTSPQWLGPLMEDIVSAVKQIETECNSTTDNPLVDGETGTVHHGGNFQAMSISLAMDRVRLSLHHIGKLVFSQMTELLNPTMNRGLPPNLAATDPSVNYFAKGLDIAAAAYLSELGWLANPVGTHVQSAEMHNQAVSSLALISARATINALEVLTMLMSTYIYVLCQAVDLRALQREFDRGIQAIVVDELLRHFPTICPSASNIKSGPLFASLMGTIRDTLDNTTTMDNVPRMHAVAQATTTPIVNYLLHASPSSVVSTDIPVPTADPTTEAAATHLAIEAAQPKKEFAYLLTSTFSSPTSSTPTSNASSPPFSPVDDLVADGNTSVTTTSSPRSSNASLSALAAIPAFRNALATKSSALVAELRKQYLTPSGSTTLGEHSSSPAPTPAAALLSPKTREIYSFVRESLGVRMHGWENLCGFDTGALDSEGAQMSGELGFAGAEGSIGMNVSRIYESIRDGKMQDVVLGMFTK